MIVRILGEGQLLIDETELAEINRLDDLVEAAAVANDQAALTATLTALLTELRAKGQPLPDDVIAESELILPDETATVEQIKELLSEAPEYPGLIPE